MKGTIVGGTPPTTERNYRRRFTPKDAKAIKEALAPLGWKGCFALRLDHAGYVVDLTVDLMPFKPSDESAR